MGNEIQDKTGSFEELLSRYDYKFSKGDLVKGIVVSVDNSGVLVDIGAKAVAYVHPKEVFIEEGKTYKESITPNEEYEFLIIKDEDEDGQLTLSHKRVAQAYSWKKIEDIAAADESVMAEVKAVVKGGLLVDVLGLKGFVPSSHLRLKKFEDCVGEKLELKILSIDSQANNLILSQRKLYNDNQSDKRKNTFENVEVGSVIEGEIVRLADFGAFVDIGGIDGLLPLSQMSWCWVDHPSDIIKVGDVIKVEVIGIDHDKQRVSLSLKNLQEDPWNKAKEEIKEGCKIAGKITRIKAFGAFVEVMPGVEALLPYKDLLEYQQQNNVALDAGSSIDTYVIKFNPSDRRISLGIKVVEAQPE
ncbi:MAG: S1 RNA-binding domain-containing protein [Candidatus Gastranaerophilales bacterium]|nr:S1 RNA-binding domain-containing protein [Candidatus Gastranaerophilales bacterium]